MNGGAACLDEMCRVFAGHVNAMRVKHGATRQTGRSLIAAKRFAKRE